MQVQKTSIRVGGRYVANVWVDAGAVGGAGGPVRPELLVPLTVSMYNAPVEAMVAIPWLRASLQLENGGAPESAISTRVTEMVMDNLPIRSLPGGGHDHQVLFRFLLTAAEIERIERARQAAGGDTFTLHLAVDALAVAVAETYNEIGQDPTPWDMTLGMFSELRPFWNTTVDPVRFTVEQSSWVRDVLPGLGYDRRRVIEIEFPPALPDAKPAATEWDKARRALDTKRYDDCVAECRDLISMWNTQLSADKKNRVADIVAKRHGWAEDDNRIGFLDGLWRAAIDFTNLPHHPERFDEQQHFDAEEARLMLLLTAALSEYVSRRTR